MSGLAAPGRLLAEKAGAIAGKGLRGIQIRKKDSGFKLEPAYDDLGNSGMRAVMPGVPGLGPSTRNWMPCQWEVLDRPAFRDTLLEELGPEVSLMFQHPSSTVSYTKRGAPKVLPTTLTASVLFAPRPSRSLVSPFELKKGGLVALNGSRSRPRAKA